jgi:hypothetical protein
MYETPKDSQISSAELSNGWTTNHLNGSIIGKAGCMFLINPGQFGKYLCYATFEPVHLYCRDIRKQRLRWTVRI